MLHCHSPVASWCSVNPLPNISDSFLLTLSCKPHNTSTQSAAFTRVTLGTCSRQTMPSLSENAIGTILSSTLQSKTSSLAMGRVMWFAIQMTVVLFQGHKQTPNFHHQLTTLLIPFTDFPLTCNCPPALPFIVSWHSHNKH